MSLERARQNKIHSVKARSPHAERIKEMVERWFLDPCAHQLNETHEEESEVFCSCPWRTE